MNIEELREGVLGCRECRELFGYEPHPSLTAVRIRELCRLARLHRCLCMKPAGLLTI